MLKNKHILDTKMNTWLLTQNINKIPGSVESAVVVAPNTDIASKIHPIYGYLSDSKDHWSNFTWVGSDDVDVKHIGESTHTEYKVIGIKFVGADWVY